ncbi:MAG: STAS domain-containing protein [Actinomycetota bacterium]|nr:STAS domain-containing protein [Actinomycetota bacterium]
MDAGERSGAVVVLLGGDGVEVEVGRVPGRRPDLAVVEALARLQLEACRRGCSIRVRDPSRELHELLDLVGLGGLVLGRGGLAPEVGRQAEGGEQLGVEEAVEPGDAAV